MKIKDFKNHNIVRSTPPLLPKHSDYKPYLDQDFSKRCAYCNLSRERITTAFEVDHFIPRAAFKKVRPSLENDYNNLVYACKKCNGTKSGKCKVDWTSTSPTNELFYDPVLVDYNTIFYRNQIGAIVSDDLKGKEMIKLLKLYRPIHILGWVCEEINETADKLQEAIDNEINADRKQKLQDALNALNAKYRLLFNLFILSYNDSEFDFLYEENIV